MATTIGGPGGFVETQILAKTPEGREQLKNIALISGSLAAGALAPAAGAGLGGTALAVGATRFGAGLALGESVYEARDRGFVEGASTYLVGSVFEKLASMTVSGMKKFMASLAADDRAVTAAQINLLKEMLKYKKSHLGKFSEAAEQRFKDGLAKLAGLNQPKQIGMDQEPFLTGWNRRLSKGDGGTLPPPLAEIPVPGGSAPSVAYAAEKTPKPIDLDAIIRSGDRSVLQYGRNVDERLKWVPPAESFSGVRRTGSAPAFTGVEKRRWVDYVRGTFGQEAGDNAARILDDPGFAGFFYPKGYADLSAKYSKMRGLFEDIAIPNEVVVGGSAGIASEGMLFRKVAAPHDLDYGVSESETRQDSKGGQAADVRAAIGGGDGGEGSPSASPATPAAPVPAGSRRIVINPSTFRNRKDALCVAWNERLRIFMEETAFEPTSEPTAKQRRFFSDTAYADDEVQLRRTILARIAVLDTSVTDPTDDQLMETMQVLQAFKGRERPTNENEAAQLDRLVGLVSSAVRARPSPGPGAAG